MSICLTGNEIPQVVCGLTFTLPYDRKSHAGTEIRKEENTAGSSSFPIMCFLDVCVLLAREDVDTSSAPIRIKASSIGGQRHALWVEIALPLLRKNIEKRPHWPNQTINVDKCQ